MKRPSTLPPYLLLALSLPVLGACGSDEAGGSIPGSADAALSAKDGGLVDAGNDPDVDAGRNPVTGDVLLAPISNIGATRGVGLLSADDGEVLSPLVLWTDFPELNGAGNPSSAAQHPNGDIYVLVEDSVVVISQSGQFLAKHDLTIAAGGTQALEFYESEVWFTTSAGRVGRIDSEGLALSDKLQLDDSPILSDVLPLSDGSFLVSNFDADAVELYSEAGVKVEDIYSINGPGRLQEVSAGEFVVTSILDDSIAFFDIDGTETARIDNLDSPGAIASLSNGNWAVSIRTNGAQACSVGNECLVQEFSVSSGATVIKTLADGPLIRSLEHASLSGED